MNSVRGSDRRRRVRHAAGLLGLAWVLWNEVTLTEGGGTKRTWTIENAFVAKPACDEVLGQYVKRMAELGLEKTAWNQTRTKDGRVRNRFLCLPDTLDPRGR